MTTQLFYMIFIRLRSIDGRVNTLPSFNTSGLRIRISRIGFMRIKIIRHPGELLNGPVFSDSRYRVLFFKTSFANSYMIINKPKKNAGNRHILVIPSEEFQPPESHQAGIFQLHQCLALKNAGYQVGVISIKQEYSLPMLLKEIFFRLIGNPAREKLAKYRLLDLPLLLYDKLFRLDRFISKEAVPRDSHASHRWILSPSAE